MKHLHTYTLPGENNPMALHHVDCALESPLLPLEARKGSVFINVCASLSFRR